MKMAVPHCWIVTLVSTRVSGTDGNFSFQAGDDPPHFDPDATEYIGKPKDMAQVLYERGKYVKDMTKSGERASYIPENPDVWQPCDIVLRDEDVGTDKSERALYRVLTIPADHTDVSSSDQIHCEHLTLLTWKCM